MNFGFSEEQELLRSEVRKFLDENCPLGEVRTISEDAAGAGYAPALWKQIGELGWIGLTIPEAHGGAGLGWVDWIVLLEETGRSLFPSPLVSTTLAAAAIQWGGSDEQQAKWLPALAEGSSIGTLAFLEADAVPGTDGIQLAADAARLSGEKGFVHDAGAADLFVVAFRDGGALKLAVLERGDAGVRAEDWPGIDLTKRTGRVVLDGAALPADRVLAHADEALAAKLLDVGAAAIVAESVGAAEAALALTTSYAQQRIQFGHPIGQFQGVKHPLADMYVDIESFKSLVYYAAWCIDEGHGDLSIAASRAKAYASESFPKLGIDVVQLHGGIGYTWEYDAHLYLKRAKWMRPAFGDADVHYERIATLGGL